jgi:benzoyl-CoA reductase/2-hydroxyglutaryl-CoA dehydratase subunit BcrC/BadD/HgdB
MKKIFCFDLDNTICNTTKSNYNLSSPKKNIIRIINNLFNKGHTIKIYTARFMGRNNDNISKAKSKGKKLTENQLKKWNLKYHKLIMGKPSFDILIDDKSIFFNKNWPKYIEKKFKIK